MKSADIILVLSDSSIDMYNANLDTYETYALDLDVIKEQISNIKGCIGLILNLSSNISIKEPVPRMPSSKIKKYLSNIIPNTLSIESSFKFGYDIYTENEIDIAYINIFEYSDILKFIIEKKASNLVYATTLSNTVTDYATNPNLKLSLFINECSITTILSQGNDAVYSAIKNVADMSVMSLIETINSMLQLSRRNFKGESPASIDIILHPDLQSTKELEKIQSSVGSKIECRIVDMKKSLFEYNSYKEPLDICYLEALSDLKKSEVILNIISKRFLKPIIAFTIATTLLGGSTFYVNKVINADESAKHLESLQAQLLSLKTEYDSIVSKNPGAVQGEVKNETVYIPISKILDDLVTILPKNCKVRNLEMYSDTILNLNIQYDFNALSVADIIEQINTSRVFEEISMENIIVTKKINNINLTLKYLNARGDVLGEDTATDGVITLPADTTPNADGTTPNADGTTTDGTTPNADGAEDTQTTPVGGE